MKRFTEIGAGKWWYVRENAGIDRIGTLYRGEVINRLAAYENTEREPSAIVDLIAENTLLKDLVCRLFNMIDLHTHEKQYRTLNEDLSVYSRESCRDLTVEEVCTEIWGELTGLHNVIERELAENEQSKKRIAVLERAFNIIKTQLVLWAKINAGIKNADLMAQAVDNAIEQAKQELADEEGELI